MRIAFSLSAIFIETDLFSRPRALAVVRIDGINGLPVGDKYIIKNGAPYLIYIYHKYICLELCLQLSSALSTVYGNQAIIELISSTNLIQPTPQPTHHVIKRAVLYTVVGMMTMDPGKDSIIYRMTTTRMKKE
uniref:DUF4258 domain-containing protein n=1 Tax=Heterorhabditis bacteriophora TaxID=37862 RepID=A0A1I7WPM1_HETBA